MNLDKKQRKNNNKSWLEKAYKIIKNDITILLDCILIIYSLIILVVLVNLYLNYY